MHYDVLIIGAGLAGICAAAAASAEGARVGIIDKGGIGLGTNSAIAHAFFTTPTPDYAAEDYIQAVLQTGKGINRVSRVRRFAREIPGALEFAHRRLKLEFSQRERGHIVESPKPEEINGVAMMRQASAGLKALPGVSILAGRQAVRILKREGRACGVLVLDKDGSWQPVMAASVVLATGGFGAIYKHNDNMRSSLGQGYYLAAQAGLDLWDMEFVQFYPLVMNQPGLPMFIVYPGYLDGIRLKNAQGEDLLAKYGFSDLNQAINKMRDQLSVALFEESASGPVMLDFTRVEGDWSEKPLSLLQRLKYDFKNKPFGLMPGAHFTMGGLKVDETGQSSLPGLLACGEVCWGMHGANRQGGNALTECLVSGMLAGRAAARAAGEAKEPGPWTDALPPEPKQETGGLGASRAFLAKLRGTAWLRAGVLRDAPGMEAGRAEAAALVSEADALPAATVRQHGARENAKAAAFCLSAVLASGRNRLESRGAFLRGDYPQQGGEGWRANSRLSYDPQTGSFRVKYIPLKETENRS